MKKLIIPLFIFIASSIFAQNIHVPYIEVTGSAEMSVTPDQVELDITLVHPHNVKTAIEELDKEIADALEAHGIPESALTYVSVDNPYYWYYWWWEYRHYSNTKTYKLKLDCSKYDFSFINDIRSDRIQSIHISSSTHSKVTEYRRQVKIEAMLAAKDKANDLLECIGQKVGDVLEVIEVIQPVNNNYWGSYYNQDITSNCIVSQPSSSSGSSASQGAAYIPTIKLRFEIKAKFEILPGTDVFDVPNVN